MPAPALSRHYRGRFAPTPSGPLHLGSLVTALASWLDARAAQGRWLLRIDDLDRARCPSGMDSRILRQLEEHGLTWDEAPRRQSAHLEDYEQAFAALLDRGRLYPCRCTRARLARSSLPGPDGPVYAGTCRDAVVTDRPCAWRFRVGEGDAEVADGIQGLFRRHLPTDVGDFVVRRSDGIFGYHLACAVDEHQQRITRVVRGADLLAATLCQQQLMDAFGHRAPDYAHLPVLLDAAGNKLSKQNHAKPLQGSAAGDNLIAALQCLEQEPPPKLKGAGPGEILAWARLHWRPDRIPRQPQLAAATRMSYT